jgi:Ca-activated chloride channel family protein
MGTLRFVGLLGCLALLGCDGYEGYYEGPPGGYGATPGGAQDIRYARSLIESGQVPPADSITVEGLLSEHDLPTEGEPCPSLLCARPAVAVAPSLETGTNAVWLQLGMTSGIQDFHRPPIDLALVIDRSSSMGGDLAQTYEAASRLIAQLRDDDRLAVVTFNDSASVLAPLGPIGDRTALLASLTSIGPSGGANLMDGLRAGYAQVRSVPESTDRLRRVIVLSCGYPTVGDTSETSFITLVRDGGAERIGLTFVGVLLSYDYALAQSLGEERGGNSYYTDSLPAIEQVFDTELDFMLTPLAYDLRIGLALSDGYEVDRVFGIPGDATGAPRTELDVATAFISNRRGAIVVRLRPVPDHDTQALGTVNLSYVPEPAHGWTDAAAEQLPVTVDTSAGVVYGSTGVHKAVALVNEAERMRTACERYHSGAPEEALAIVTELADYLRAEAEALNDDGLRTEVALVEALAAAMSLP